MNSIKGILLSLLLTLVQPLVVVAASTQFTSPNYTVESIILGGTGALRTAPLITPPTITAGPTTRATTTTSIIVNWTTDKSSSSSVLYGTEAGNLTDQAGQIGDTIYTDHLVQLKQLTRGTRYFYRVRSTDAMGNRVESAEETFTTDPGDTTPPRVTSGPITSQTSATSLTITWETDELSNTTVQYGTATVTENAVGRSDELTLFHQVTLSGLQAATLYQLRVRSTDSSNNLYTSPTQEIVMPSAPSITDVKVSDITLNSAVVQWRTTAASTSLLEYGTASRSYSEKIEDSSPSENHTIRLSGLGNGTTYYLRISGKDGSNNQLASDEYVFKTVILPVITDFKVSEVTADSALLTWTSSSDIDELIRYEVSQNAEPKLIGKKQTAGNDQLVSQHSYRLSDLESGSTYQVSALGKDVFGNQALSQNLELKTLPDSEAPLIENVKSDTTVDLGSKQSVQVLVSFGLSELGTAIIEYGTGPAGGDYSEKVMTDTDLSRSKFMVIPGLQPGTTYHFRIVATDRSNNQAVSSDYLVLAPAQGVSLFDLIADQIKFNFGWFSKL